jgi:pyrroline-5-carboxylate reductase
MTNNGMINQAKMHKVAIIGCGHIGTQLIDSFIKHSIFKPKEIIATRKNFKLLTRLSNKYSVNTTTDNKKAAGKSEIIILCVRPEQMKNVILEIVKFISNQVIISTAVGLELSFYQQLLPQKTIIRVMPNTFLDKGLGTIPFSTSAKGFDSCIKKLFKPLCEELIKIDDRQMHLFTTVAASSGALFYAVFLAMQKYCEENNISPREAKKIVLLTAKSAAQTCSIEDDFEELIKLACTPGGMTAQGIEYLKEKNFYEIIKKSLDLITQGSKEIHKKYAN